MGTKTLFAQLKDLRQQIRAEVKKSTGMTENICSDSVLLNMSKIMPKNLNDLAMMNEITEDFIAQYGKRFIQCILNYSMRNNLIDGKGSNYVATLKELEKKLVNLSRRNRLLYSNQLANKYGIDLLSVMKKQEIYDFLFDKEVTSIKICDLTEPSPRKAKQNEKQYNKLVQLTRELNREKREKGQYDLFIAYPFVRGRLIGEDFEVNAPLVLFPVILTKDTSNFVLSKDNTRDVVYNNNILLANYKFSRINKALPNNSIYDITKEDFFTKILEFYKTEQIDIQPSQMDLAPYVAPTDENKSFKRGELLIYNSILLGKYSTYSSSMQKDLNTIINSGTINPLLEDLLSGMDDYDFYSDTDDERQDLVNPKEAVQESDLCYINPINSTQENVILASDNCREFVIEGPPGTGKSQVITNLIANAVSKGKSVLMVSEKKSALDVVYSRLGNLSKYVLLLDDVNNKDIFYHQVDAMCKVELSGKEPKSLEQIDQDIEDCMDAMNAISSKLCDSETYGIEVYKLYQICPKWDLSDKQKANDYNIIASYISDRMIDTKYQDINRLCTTFKSSNLVNCLVEYKKDSEKYPQLQCFKGDLSQTELASIHNDCEQMVSALKILKKMKLDRKSGVKRALKKQAKGWFKAAYVNKKDGDKQDYLDNIAEYATMTSKYDNFIKNKLEYNELNDLSRDYFEALYGVSEELNISTSEANDLIFKFMINQYLINFETNNRSILSKTYDYSIVLKKLSELSDNKVAITKENLQKIFEENLKGLINGKRYGEMRRIMESQRRWTVAKFIDKFFLELFTSVKVWLLTPEVVSEILPLKAELFDMVVFDEASQLYIEKGIPAILRAKSVIIAGDSKQLRPSNLGAGRIEYDDDQLDDMQEDSGIAALEEESLLDVARFKYPPIMLDFHYRSKYSELIAFSNYAFYGGQLNVSPNPCPPSQPPIKVVKVKGGMWENRANVAEAQAVVDNLKSFLRNRKNNETVGIITFNSAQRDLILDIIDETAKKDKRFAKAVNNEFARTENGEDIGLFVKNIENVQGDERDCIIFSIGYAQNEDGKVVKNFGWLSQRGGENRLNVAISRAKTQITIVSSIEPEDLEVDNCKNAGPKILRKYLQYCNCVSKGDKDGANGILLSFVDNDKSKIYSDNKPAMAAKLREGIEAHGFKVEENIGVGAYTIDMAVVYGDKYILGIEFDSTLFSVNSNNRERDFHRWRYFKLRGWKMHRIWSSSWWDNPEDELNKVLARLDKMAIAIDKESELSAAAD